MCIRFDLHEFLNASIMKNQSACARDYVAQQKFTRALDCCPHVRAKVPDGCRYLFQTITLVSALDVVLASMKSLLCARNTIPSNKYRSCNNLPLINELCPRNVFDETSVVSIFSSFSIHARFPASHVRVKWNAAPSSSGLVIALIITSQSRLGKKVLERKRMSRTVGQYCAHF